VKCALLLAHLLGLFAKHFHPPLQLYRRAGGYRCCWLELGRTVLVHLHPSVPVLSPYQTRCGVTVCWTGWAAKKRGGGSGISVVWRRRQTNGAGVADYTLSFLDFTGREGDVGMHILAGAFASEEQKKEAEKTSRAGRCALFCCPTGATSTFTRRRRWTLHAGETRPARRCKQEPRLLCRAAVAGRGRGGSGVCVANHRARAACHYLPAVGLQKKEKRRERGRGAAFSSLCFNWFDRVTAWRRVRDMLCVLAVFRGSGVTTISWYSERRRICRRRRRQRATGVYLRRTVHCTSLFRARAPAARSGTSACVHRISCAYLSSI